MSQKGLFITFEGIEGGGKSTQIGLLDSYLQTQGYQTLLTREPGGTIIGEKIRLLLLDVDNAGMTPTTELLLYAAARAQHVQDLILPALHRGTIVLCDRYFDATSAYQGAARQLPKTTLDQLHTIATNQLIPDLTFLLDLPVERGLKMAKGRRGAQDRLEQEAVEFHERVRQGYLKIAKEETKRVKIINGVNEIDAIHEEIKKYATDYIRSSGTN